MALWKDGILIVTENPRRGDTIKTSNPSKGPLIVTENPRRGDTIKTNHPYMDSVTETGSPRRGCRGPEKTKLTNPRSGRRERKKFSSKISRRGMVMHKTA